MDGMNTKVKRMLDAIAIVMKDERPALIRAVHDVIADKRDGYPYNFMAVADSAKTFCKGSSIKEDGKRDVYR